jgi:hypothetical protein
LILPHTNTNVARTHSKSIQVADVCVEALVCDGARNKVVEIVSEVGQPVKTADELFAGVR